MPSASGTRRSPLEGIERLLVDGTNLLHAIRRGAPAAPPATLVGRLRGVIELPVRIELIFDGPPDPGLGNARIASGLVVRYSGHSSADSLLARMVAEAVDPGTLLVVTDDVDLRHQIVGRGGHTASAHWLIARLDRSRLSAPIIGRPNPAASAAGVAAGADQARGGGHSGPTGAGGPTGPGGTGDDRDDASASTWRPGRGATAKKGNPRRRPKSGGRPAG